MNIASNSIEIYTLFERIHTALIQAMNDDGNFLEILVNTQVIRMVDVTLESLLQEINELIKKFNEFF